MIQLANSRSVTAASAVGRFCDFGQPQNRNSVGLGEAADSRRLVIEDFEDGIQLRDL